MWPLNVLKAYVVFLLPLPQFFGAIKSKYGSHFVDSCYQSSWAARRIAKRNDGVETRGVKINFIISTHVPLLFVIALVEGKREQFCLSDGGLLEDSQP